MARRLREDPIIRNRINAEEGYPKGVGELDVFKTQPKAVKQDRHQDSRFNFSNELVDLSRIAHEFDFPAEKRKLSTFVITSSSDLDLSATGVFEYVQLEPSVPG
jgi:hypothetical protein